MRSAIALTLLGLAATAIGTPGYKSDRGDDNSSVATSSSQAPVATTTSTASSALIGMHGDVACSSLLCVGGLVNGSTIQYTVQSLRSSVGWMAMGFGTRMANTPMVIMWANSDGNMTLSQRQASGHVMPTVVSSPPRTATAQSSLSVLSGTNPKFVYTLPYQGETTQNIIWAFGTTSPGSSAVDASIQQHIDAGSTRLALGTTLAATSKDPTNPISIIGSGSSGNNTDSQPSTGGGGSSTIPLRDFEKYIVAHAILCIVGFLGLLPFGALAARFFRTFTNHWFKAHWIIQFGLALPVVTAGVALGIYAVENHESGQLADDHKKWGIAIFVLYFVQVFLGGFIHSVKPKSFVVDRKRPLQNYFHAILGLFIIGVAFYQVRTGYKTEWPMMTGRDDIGKAADIVWYIWIVVIPLAYFGGLFFLRRQFRQEKVVKPSTSTASVNKPLRSHSHTESI